MPLKYQSLHRVVRPVKANSLFVVQSEDIILETGTENSEAQQTDIDIQPESPVEGGSEELEASPQADNTEDQELYVDDEPDTTKSNMSQEQAYAAFRKEQEKRKKKNQQLQTEREEKQRIQRELDELKKTVGSMQKGAPPTLESCDFDEALFQQKTREYYANPEPSPAAPEQAPQAQTKVNDEAQFYLYQKEQDIMKVMPSYADAKESVRNHLTSHDEIQDADLAFEFMSDIARQKGVDVAKAIVAIDKRPSIIGELLRAGSNQILIADILEQAAGRVKTRSKKQIDSEPVPKVTNRGPIDHSAAKIQKLREAWVKNPNSRNYQAYKLAKEKTKGN